MKKLLLLILLFILNSINAQELKYFDTLDIKFDLIYQTVKEINKSIDSINKYSDSISNFNESKKKKIEKKPQFKFYVGTEEKLTKLKIASLCAPVFWYSPDEPELNFKTGAEINIPKPYPFEEDSGNPVVYFHIYPLTDYTNDTIDLSKINEFTIYYTHYYKYDRGLGKHKHDNEQVQFVISIDHNKINGTIEYELILKKVIAKAHNLFWYDNVFELTDTLIGVKLPIHILVEEGKHASCTDINADGYFMPGYDVNEKINDAWGVRDVIITGNLISSEYQGWMTKVRKDNYKVIPPLPEESLYYIKFVENNKFSPNNSVYELRPMPNIENVKDKSLKKDLKEYVKVNRFNVKAMGWMDPLNEITSSITYAYRYNNGNSIAVSFPLFVYRNFEVPIINGWLVNKIYLNEKDNTYTYCLLYTPSASRFLDPYFSVGMEFSDNNYFVFETGVKIRFEPKFYSIPNDIPLLSSLNFWGIRFGIKKLGLNLNTIEEFSYVFEFGFGVF